MFCGFLSYDFVMKEAFLKFGESVNGIVSIFFIWWNNDQLIVIIVSAMQDGNTFAGEFFDWFKYTKYIAIEFFPVGTFRVGYETVIHWVDKIVAGVFAAEWAIDFNVDDFANIFDVLFHVLGPKCKCSHRRLAG